MQPAPLGNDLQLNTGRRGVRPLTLSRGERNKHLYICGGTGTGKSKFLEHLVRQDILGHYRSKCGLLLLDPHGSLYDSLMAWLAYHRPKHLPIIPIDLRRDDWVVSYNLLRKRQKANAATIVDSTVEAMSHVWGQMGTDQTPLFARWATNILHALYEKNLTLVEAIHLTGLAKDVRQAMTNGLSNGLARRDWELANALSARDFEAQVSSTVNRLQRFLSNENMRCIFGVPEVSLDLGKAIEEGHIILVSLARDGGRVSRENADLFATLLLTDLWNAAQERGKKESAKPFYVYLDEFQRFVTPSIAEGLDQARGFGLHMTMAHQYPKQLLDMGNNGRQLYNSVMENASSKVVFRLSDEENLKPMAQWLFRSVMNPDEIKHSLYSTKVMAYRKELWRSSTTSRTQSEGGGISRGEMGIDGEITSEQSSDQQSWVSATTESETSTPTLVPMMGKELSSVQFRSLEEQLHRSMAALFEQPQRHAVARLVGMRVPLPIEVPLIRKIGVRQERVNQYVHGILKKTPFALPFQEAVRRLAERESTLGNAFEWLTADEPATSKRRLK